jgi:hypothetical protein
MPAQCEPWPEKTHTAPSDASGRTVPVTTEESGTSFAKLSNAAAKPSTSSATTAARTGSCERRSHDVAAIRSIGSSPPRR